MSSPPGIRGRIFVSSNRQGGQLLNFKNQGGDTFRGRKMILGSQAGRELLYHGELLVFPQNVSPWILQILPPALSYIFLTFSWKGSIRCYCFKIIELTIMDSQWTGKKICTSCWCFYLVFFICLLLAYKLFWHFAIYYAIFVANIAKHVINNKRTY